MVTKGSSVAITLSSGAYEGGEEQDGGAFLLSGELFGDRDLASAKITVIVRVGNENKTLLEQEYSRAELMEKEVWVKYPLGSKSLRVLLNGEEVVNLSLE